MENDDLVKKIENYRTAKANILIPSMQTEGFSEFHKPILETIMLDTDDYYEQERSSKKYIISGHGLQKIAVCAGIVWNPGETRPTCTQRDYVAYNAVGCVRKIDGSLVCYQAEYDLDMEVVEEEIAEKNASKAEAGLKKSWFRDMPQDAREAYIDKKISKDVLYKRKHKTKLAATGAKNRVIRALIGLKKIYTSQELDKPFVILRVILQPDYTDPEIKKMMLQASIQAITGVYGGGVQPPRLALLNESSESIGVPPADEEPQDIDGTLDYKDPAEVEKRLFIDVMKTTTTDDEPPDIDGPPDGEENPDFKNSDKKNQILMIEQLAEARFYDFDGLKKPLSEFTESQRIAFWDKLVETPCPPQRDITYNGGDLMTQVRMKRREA